MTSPVRIHVRHYVQALAVLFLTSVGLSWRRLSSGILWCLASSLVLSWGCGSTSAQEDEPVLSQWTVMVYMAGDADISDAAFADFNEMEQVGSSTEVRIVAQVEFDPRREPYPPGSTLRGLITPDDDPDAIGSDLADIGNRDMTNPQTLREFITWAASRYPARNYLLLLWGHGTGWKPLSFSAMQSKGMFTDQSSDQTSAGTLMAIGDLAGAILDSGIVFDVINLDACLMGMYEVAFELQDCAHHLSFSQGLYPIHGDPYAEILRSLGENPRMISRELSRTIVQKTSEFYEARGVGFTKSSLDLSGLQDLHEGISRVADLILLDFDRLSGNVRQARDESLHFHITTGQYTSTDLGDFLTRLGKFTGDEELDEAVYDLRNLLAECVVENGVFSPSMEPLGRSQGLSIYLPAPGEANATDLERYSGLSCNQGSPTTWADLVTAVVTDGESRYAQ